MDRMDCLNETNGEAVGLLTTYRCNLNCKYCYVQTKRNKDMSLDMAKSILEPFLMKNSGRLDITFMGGETLLAIDVIRPLVEWVESGNWNRSYRFFGSTNGTLLNTELKKWLRKYADVFTLGLSYDGLPSAQANNRGNDNIDLDFFIQTWSEQPIQMTINTDTVGQMADGVIYLLEKGALVHPNVAYESMEWSEKDITEYAIQLDKLTNYYNNNPEKPLISQFIHNLSEYADNIDNHKELREVCGAGNGFQVFDVNGESYPCHILSPLVLSDEKLEKVKNGVIHQINSDSNLNCQFCPYMTTCPTCIACNFLYRDGLHNRDKTHCQIMKLEVKAYIKKEVQRLTVKEKITPEDATEIDAIKKLLEYETAQNISQNEI